MHISIPSKQNLEENEKQILKGFHSLAIKGKVECVSVCVCPPKFPCHIHGLQSAYQDTKSLCS